MPPQDIATARSVPMNCIHDISSWCSSRRLQLNSEKTELIWFDSRHTLQNVNHEDLTLQLGSTVIEPARVVCDLGVLLDDELAMKQHISKVASMHLLLSATAAAPAEMLILGREVTAQSQRLPYYASTIVLAGLPLTTLKPLQRVHNAAARLILSLNLRDHVKPALKQLHWLPVVYRIQYKLCPLMHHVHFGTVRQYLTDAVHCSVCHLSQSPIWSALGNTAKYVKRCTRTKFGERGLSFSGPAAWNMLPEDLQCCSGTNVFKKQLKTVLFRLAFNKFWPTLDLICFCFNHVLLLKFHVVSAPLDNFVQPHSINTLCIVLLLFNRSSMDSY